MSVQQFRDGVMLRMCCGLTLATLFVRFFDRYYVDTIPKSRCEFLDSFLIFLFVEFLEGIPCIVNLHSFHYPIIHLSVEDSHVLEALLME